MRRLALFVFGPPRIELDGKPASLDRGKAVALLVYLAVTGATHTRQALAALFWPEYDTQRAFAYLRRTLWALNDALGEGWIASDRETLSLADDASIWCDLHEFRARLEGVAAHHHPPEAACPGCIPLLEEAVRLYSADFLAGFGLRDSPAFDDWQFFQSESLRRDLAGALERLAGAHAAQGNWDAAIHFAHRRLALDPLEEASHRRLMDLYDASGQRSAALRQYAECARLLEAELGVTPQPETRALMESIKSGKNVSRFQVGMLQVDPPQPVSSPPQPANVQPSNLQPDHLPTLAIPAQLTPFIGREAELKAILALLEDPACRMLTLLGPGGIGKTRLAIEAARQAQALPAIAGESSPGGYRFANGLYFIYLAPLSSGEFLVEAIGEALNYSFWREDPHKTQLLDYLREKSFLLVLDNFEHLVASAELLTEILAEAPQVKLLVSSRERLNLPEEWVVEVQGMDLPAGDEDKEILEASSAVRLFLQKARRSRADFFPSEAELTEIVRVCRLVQGMPLAIELAAAWVKALSLSEISRQIQTDLDFLATSLRGVPERHQSLRTVFEHSWKLLTDAERQAVSRLSVFRGAYRLEGAAALISPDGFKGAQMLLTLSALVDKSMLLRVGSPQEPRYIMHELLKQYAAEKLRQLPGEEQIARRQHCLYYSSFIADRHADLMAERQIEGLEEIEASLEDLRLAWRWSLEHESLSILRPFLLGLSQFFDMRCRFAEGEDIFRQTVDHLRGVPAGYERDSLLALSLRWLATYGYAQGKFQEAHPRYLESLDIVRRLDSLPGADEDDIAFLNAVVDFGLGVLPQEEVRLMFYDSARMLLDTGNRWGLAISKLIMGDRYPFGGILDAAASRQMLQESLELFEGLKNPWGQVLALNALGNLNYALGEYAETKRLSLQALPIIQQVGDPWRMGNCLLILGQAVTALGEYERAIESYSESLKVAREIGNRSMIAVNLDCLGYSYFLLEDYGRAEACYRESLALTRSNQDMRGAGMALVNLGDVARARGDLLQARQLYIEAQVILEKVDNVWGLGLTLKKLGTLTCQMGELGASRDYFQRSLQIMRTVDRFPEMLDILIQHAELLAKEGRLEEAVEALTYCSQHSATAQPARQRAEQLLAELSAELPPASFEAARQRACSNSLDNLVAVILG